jgi:regulator of sirC expression with transglutaminase-like and TPR domain
MYGFWKCRLQKEIHTEERARIMASQNENVTYRGGMYDQQDATNTVFIAINALHVSGHHCPSSGARNCMCSRTVL